MKKTIIIGAGIAGMAVSKRLKEEGIDSVVIEKNSKPGGLCKSFSIQDAWFDLGGHVTFAKDEYVRNLLEKDKNYHSTIVAPFNYKEGKWIKFPAQNNLRVMDTEEKIRIIEDFVNRPEIKKPSNYKEWLYANYGQYFSDNYPALYTKKYWTIKPEQLETKWVGVRMYKPTLKEVLFGAFEEETPDLHYSNGVRYPLTGGFEAFLKMMEEESDIYTNKELVSINTEKKLCIFSDGDKQEYENLVVCAPLPEIIPKIENVPACVVNSSKLLNHTSLALVSFCLKNAYKSPCGIFYIYDEDILPSRVYSTNTYSNKTSGSYALQAEVYYSRFKKQDRSLEEIRDIVRKQLVDIGVMDEKDIVAVDVRYEKYANVMFTHDIYENRKVVHDYLDSLGILYAGRFGEWDYLWTDQAILSGKRAAEKLINKA